MFASLPHGVRAHTYIHIHTHDHSAGAHIERLLSAAFPGDYRKRKLEVNDDGVAPRGNRAEGVGTRVERVYAAVRLFLR